MLLLGSMLWGQCASCPLFKAPAEASHDCCHHGAPGKGPGHDRCPNDAVSPVTFDKAGLNPTLVLQAAPAAAHVVVAALPPVTEVPLAAEPANAVLHAPPDLCVLHSVLLV